MGTTTVRGGQEAVCRVRRSSGSSGWTCYVHLPVHGDVSSRVCPVVSPCYQRAMSQWGELRVAAVQMCSTDDLAANLATCRALTAQAATEGAQLVVLPECFSFLGR